jgi:hypothetical protein
MCESSKRPFGGCTAGPMTGSKGSAGEMSGRCSDPFKDIEERLAGLRSEAARLIKEIRALESEIRSCPRPKPQDNPREPRR